MPAVPPPYCRLPQYFIGNVIGTELLCTLLLACGLKLSAGHPIEVDRIVSCLLEVISTGPNHLKALTLNVGDLPQPMQPQPVPQHQTSSVAMAPVQLLEPGGVAQSFYILMHAPRRTGKLVVEFPLNGGSGPEN